MWVVVSRNTRLSDITPSKEKQQEIGEELFDQWSYNNLEEGSEYAENQFMQYASDDLKKQYNEFYGYVEGDDYYLC